MTIRFTHVAGAIVLAATAFSSVAFGQTIVGRADAAFTLREAVRAGQWVRIASPNGAVRVTEGGDGLDLTATKVIRRGTVDDIGFIVRRDADGVTVCAVYDDTDTCGADGRLRTGNRPRDWWSGRDVKVDFAVRVPAGVKVRAASGNGDVSVTGGGAEVLASSGNGRVDVTGPGGSVTANSGNGRVTVENARGPVEASTGNGDVRVTTSNGPVNATSGNGDIDVSMGRLDGSPDMNYSTGNGNVRVAVPAGFGAELDSHTSGGDVTVDFPLTTQGRISKSRLRGRLGSGGGRLTMSSGNGDLAIVQRP